MTGLSERPRMTLEQMIADDFGTVDSVARDVIKVENVVDFSVKENIAERFAKKIGAEAGAALSTRFLGNNEQPALR